MLIKAGVDISRLKPEIRKRLPGIAGIVWFCTKEEMVITSTYEGSHSEGSLHYANLAVNIRRKAEDETVYWKIKKYLFDDYDVILEADHIHIEYNPKEPSLFIMTQ